MLLKDQKQRQQIWDHKLEGKTEVELIASALVSTAQGVNCSKHTGFYRWVDTHSPDFSLKLIAADRLCLKETSHVYSAVVYFPVVSYGGDLPTGADSIEEILL